MSNIAFSEFIAKFHNLRQFPINTGMHPAISTPDKNKSFVQAPIQLITSKSTEQTPIIIISAPGAVGKSTFAKQLCAEIGAYYWNLSQTKLGNYTFRGTISDAFEPLDSEVLTELKSGNLIFVLDAFDEADVLSGWEGVDIFVRDAWKQVKDSTLPALIMFARHDTATYIQMLLDELGEGKQYYDSYQIQYFDKEQAISFVRLFVKNQESNSTSKPSTIDQHIQPFTEAVESAFQAVSQTFGVRYEEAWATRAVKDFLGYAPVLQAIAKFISDSGENYQLVRNKIKQAGANNSGVELLNQLLNELLLRDQEKFLSAFKQRVSDRTPHDWSEWNSLYSPNEQLTRLFSYCFGTPVLERPILR